MHNISRTDHILASMPSSEIGNLRSIVKYIDNWYDVLLFRAGAKKRIEIRFRSGKKVRINNMREYADFWVNHADREYVKQFIKHPISIGKDTVYVEYRNKKLKFHYDTEKQFAGVIGSINDIFRSEAYEYLHVKGKVVLDIGAGIGDSAIYFLVNGAKRVYSYEPMPYSFRLAKRNIAINGFKRYVALVNAAVGKRGSVVLDEKFGDASSMLKPSSKGKRVQIFSLRDIINKHKISSAVMKVDCEGGEYPFLLNARSEELRRFPRIAIEYHYGYKDLVEKLQKAGFTVRYTRPQRGTGLTNNRKMYMGMIYAELSGRAS